MLCHLSVAWTVRSRPRMMSWITLLTTCIREWRRWSTSSLRSIALRIRTKCMRSNWRWITSRSLLQRKQSKLKRRSEWSNLRRNEIGSGQKLWSSTKWIMKIKGCWKKLSSLWRMWSKKDNSSRMNFTKQRKSTKLWSLSSNLSEKQGLLSRISPNRSIRLKH